MTGPRPLTCPRCGAEAHSALPLCSGCGALLSISLEATALRPQGFGREAAGEAAPVVVSCAPAAPAALAPSGQTPFLAPAAMPAAADLLAPAPPAPAPAPAAAAAAAPFAPPAAAASAASPSARKRRKKGKPLPPTPEAFLAQYGLAPGPEPAPAPATAPPVAPYPLAADVTPPPQPQWNYVRHGAPAAPQPPAAPAYVPLPLAVARGGSAAKEPEAEEAKPKVSALAVIGFILSLACGPLGLVLSLIAYARIKASKGRLTGQGLAVLAIVIGAVWLMAWSSCREKKPSKPRRAAVTLTLPVA